MYHSGTLDSDSIPEQWRPTEDSVRELATESTAALLESTEKRLVEQLQRLETRLEQQSKEIEELRAQQHVASNGGMRVFS